MQFPACVVASTYNAMIVPDFTPLGASFPTNAYHRMMVSMMEQGNNYRGFLGRSPPPIVRSPPHLTRSPPHLLCSPSALMGRSEPLLRRPDYRLGRDSDLHISTFTPSTGSTPKMDVAVSPDSSETGSCLSPSSEKSQMFISSEDGDSGTVDGPQTDKDGFTDRKAFKCPQCLYFTDRKNNLKRHIVTMHQECSKTLECCGVMFLSKAALRDHVGLFHRGGYRCQICSRNFCRKALLRRHLTVHSGRKDFSCDLCGYATSHKSNLERHQKVHLRRPVCATTREECPLLPPLPPLEKQRASHYYPKFGGHREKTINRFVLLPNRIKYTHRGTPSATPKRKQSPDVTPLSVQDAENNAMQDEDVNIDIDLPIYKEDASQGTSFKPGTVIRQDSDVENMQTEVYSCSQEKTKNTSSKLSLLSSRSRIFVTPYKCFECGMTFSKQGDLHAHKCRTQRQTSDTGLSVITAVRKGQIKLLSQMESDMKPRICDVVHSESQSCTK
ncbi:zinc finger protein 729-like [Haliotis rufescens]|uniref:zinc finger protein 729-like n=1 Tax=Haliotis rufescens TaxID=6454 RepID=UPI00201F4A27|nr:zinc finger protein 729-like [Haliotis rufescens]